MKKKITKAESTYDLFIKDPAQKELLDAEYKELLISEMLLAALENDERSVRELAKAAGVSPTIIQELKTSKRPNITLSTFTKVVDVLGYNISIAPKPKF